MDDRIRRVLEELASPCCGYEAIYTGVSGARFTCKNLPHYFVEWDPRTKRGEQNLCEECLLREGEEGLDRKTLWVVSKEARLVWKQVTERWIKIGSF